MIQIVFNLEFLFKSLALKDSTSIFSKETFSCVLAPLSSLLYFSNPHQGNFFQSKMLVKAHYRHKTHKKKLLRNMQPGIDTLHLKHRLFYNNFLEMSMSVAHWFLFPRSLPMITAFGPWTRPIKINLQVRSFNRSTLRD